MVFGVAVITLAVVFVLSRSTPEINTNAVAGDDLAELLAGNTLVGKGYAFYYAVDGKMHGVVQGYRDSGVWSVEQDKVCVQWKTWGHGKLQRWLLRWNGTMIERTGVEGSIRNELTWHKGNFRNL